ncbi:MAG TPA: hypothetical protein VK868_12055 [Pyrinomonadaceae bacterium]|nr:hypothetical protein [Pyrinomonadaceae bacterium]
MRKNNCNLIRRELDELMLGEAWSSSATEHLRECASCREFHEQQTKLRQIVGSLGTVEAPADFDFRLRARLANEGNSAAGIYWAFVRRGLAVAAMVIVFATGAILVRNLMNQPGTIDNVAQQPQVHQPVKPQEVTPVVKEQNKPDEMVAGAAKKIPVTIRPSRGTQAEYRKRPLSTIDSSSFGAKVFKEAEPVGVSPAFSIDTSVQSFKVSLDDGRGNAKTISVPTISFGSQRIVQSGNEFAPKRDW